MNRNELLKIGERIAPFTLPVDRSRETLLSSDIIGKRRTMLLVAGDDLPPVTDWLRTAREQATALEERDVRVLVLVPDPEAAPALTDLPAPTFQVLRDAYHEEEKRLGGAPAFYLVGKDGTIKRAERDFPPLEDLIQLIDSMPMRQQEMRES